MTLCDAPAMELPKVYDPENPCSWDGTWTILRTAPNSEQAAADLLWKYGVQNYFPRYLKETSYDRMSSGGGDRQKYSRLLPVFQRYLPVCQTPDDDLERIQFFFFSYFGAKPIKFTNPDGSVSEKRHGRFLAQLAGVYLAEQMGKLTPYVLPVKGQRVRILDGAFKDFECLVVEDGRRRFAVKLPDTMGAAELQIEPERLEILSD